MFLKTINQILLKGGAYLSTIMHCADMEDKTHVLPKENNWPQ